MGPITISAVVFACVFGSALLGIFIHSLLPKGHLDSDSKEAVRLGMALVGTTLALVLGLLIASSKGFYDTQSSEVTQLAADVVVLDRVLLHFGPETKEIRDLLRHGRKTVRTRPSHPSRQMKEPSLAKFSSSLRKTTINDSCSHRR